MHPKYLNSALECSTSYVVYCKSNITCIPFALLNMDGLSFLVLFLIQSDNELSAGLRRTLIIFFLCFESVELLVRFATGQEWLRTEEEVS